MTNQLQPGRELDEAIARLLGWVKSQDRRSFGGSSLWLRVGTYPICLPHFSTNDAIAFATLQQLCKPVEEGGRGWGHSYHSPGVLGYGKNHCLAIFNGKKNHCLSTVWSEVSFAHAAALAIHAALEVEK